MISHNPYTKLASIFASTSEFASTDPSAVTIHSATAESIAAAFDQLAVVDLFEATASALRADKHQAGVYVGCSDYRFHGIERALLRTFGDRLSVRLSFSFDIVDVDIIFGIETSNPFNDPAVNAIRFAIAACLSGPNVESNFIKFTGKSVSPDQLSFWVEHLLFASLCTQLRRESFEKF